MSSNPIKQKPVESGREHTGRWTKEEHEAFLSALQLYGKEWKKVAAKVKTRTVVQTRTHAQKYFQKLSKVLEDGNVPAGLEGGILRGSGSLSLGSSSAAIRSAQSLAASMQTDQDKKKRAAPATGGKAKKQAASLAAATAQSIAAPVATAAAMQQPQQTPRTTSTAEALLNMSAFTGPIEEPYANQPAEETHGFYTQYSTYNPILPPDNHQVNKHSLLQIKAPPPNTINEKHPEPSPAACGKRKIAEITAAQMLVGVHNNDANATNAAILMNASAEDITNEYSPNPLKPLSFEDNTDDDAFLAEVFGVSDTAAGGGGGTAGGTPENKGTGTTTNFGSNMTTSLQIVNPDTLYDSHPRSVVNGQASPSTPWDGQLEALVSHVHQQEQESEVAQHQQPINNSIVLDPIISPVNQNSTPLPLRNPSSDLEFAICNASISTIITQLKDSGIPNKLNDTGYHVLHMAASLSILPGVMEEAPLEISRRIIEAGGDVTVRDKDGNTAMHWAARGGHVGLVRLLLNRNCPMDAQNDNNETSLHWAMRAGSRAMATVQLLVESGARTNLYSRSHKRPLDVAAEGFAALNEDESEMTIQENTTTLRVDQRERKICRWNMLRFSPQCRTLVLHHHECLDHMTKSNHDWEVPDRIDILMSTLADRTSVSCPPENETNFNACEITVSNEFERATLELLSRIHSADYLAFVNELSKDLDRKRKQQLLENVQNNSEMNFSEHHVVPFTPMIQKKFIKEAMAKADGHSDTSFSAGSLKAARRAAGAVQHAVDCVLVGRNRNAFCVVRPPGHHAGINGLLSDAESCGFCLFNNVAAGAMHALSDEKHRPRCERCAIVDIDAHHGNGTEEIVRKCHDSGRLLFFSVHLYDYDKPKKTNEFNYKFYPGTGVDDDVPHNVINVPIAPLWREKEVIKSITSSSNGSSTTERAQTRLKTKADSRVSSSTDLKSMAGDDPMQQVGDGSELNNALASKPKSQPPTSSPNYPPHYLMGVGRLAYRRAIQHRLLPALRAFNPDLIIMSTGFDAARGDVGNARHFVNGTQAMGLDLEPEDYAWTSKKICEVADICCNGRVVSVLEGGYGRTPPAIPPPPLAEATSTEEVRQPLEKGFFSECAMHHLKGLVDPYAE